GGWGGDSSGGGGSGVNRRRVRESDIEDRIDRSEGNNFEVIFDDEVQRNEAIPLSDKEIALDASSEGILSPRGTRYDYVMSSEAEDDR
nr:hypothetical protein [Tanacetum cinerariifolium]